MSVAHSLHTLTDRVIQSSVGETNSVKMERLIEPDPGEYLSVSTRIRQRTAGFGVLFGLVVSLQLVEFSFDLAIIDIADSVVG